MKTLLLIPVMGCIFLLGTFAEVFAEAWDDRRYARPRLLAAWNYIRWDDVFMAAFYGMLFGATLVAIRLLLF